MGWPYGSSIVSSPQHQAAQNALNNIYRNAIFSGAMQVRYIPPEQLYQGFHKVDPFANRAGRVALAQHIETTSGRPL